MVIAEDGELPNFLDIGEKCRGYDVDSGRKIIILPTCTLPEHHLLEENWDSTERSINYGHFRRVRNIRKLKTGEKTAIYVKGPERVFTTFQKNLEEGYVWWGGPRSGEKYIYVSGEVVEEQVEWEAIFLLGLYGLGIKAEIPQAIVEHSDGTKELILEAVAMARDSAQRISSQSSYEEELVRIRNAGLVPIDYGGHNTLRDNEGYPVIIDVNRWEWQPHSNEFRNRLIEQVRRAVK